VTRGSKPQKEKSMLKANRDMAVFFLAIFISTGVLANSYCELEGATTESGEEVTGLCYMYSRDYGELEGAETESGESVTGECYRYSKDYAELESAETESGESVTGECYFY
jgi:hypothetical protein